jgi:hypothetical protein
VFGWNEGVQLVPAGGGKVTFLPMTGRIAGRRSDAFAFAWAPDSRHVLTVVSTDTVPYQTMWSVPLDGGPPRPLIRFDDPLTAFGRGAFAALDSTIYFAMLRSESDVWVAEVGRK